MKVVISLILFVFCFVINNYHPVSAMNQYESLGYDTLEEAEVNCIKTKQKIKKIQSWPSKRSGGGEYTVYKCVTNKNKKFYSIDKAREKCIKHRDGLFYCMQMTLDDALEALNLT